MTEPVWVTPAGSLGLYGAALPITPIQLEANPVAPATSVTYKLYSGNLPTGLTLSSSGLISGTIVENLINSTISFTVVATDDIQQSSLRNFSIDVIAHDPVWVTPSSVLGTYASGYDIEPIQLLANPVSPATSVYYRMIVGSLPPGLKISKFGVISGKPNYPHSTEPMQFTIQAVDNRGLISNRDFSIVVEPSNPKWITPAGLLGSFTRYSLVSKQLVANPVLPATHVTYKLLSGELPTGVYITNGGIVLGTITDAITDKTWQFVVRATDNYGNINDRTFSIQATGTLAPTFNSPEGLLFNTIDSVWIEYQVDYTNPNPDNPVVISLVNGELPPGLEISPNGNGLIRGYPEPPVVAISLTEVNATATSTTTNTNTITVLSTVGFVSGRPIQFSGDVLGGLQSGITYYVKEVLTNSTFTISSTINGPVVLLNNDSGLMDCLLPATLADDPTSKIYSFTLKILSGNGSQLRAFSIKVINQNAPPPAPNLLAGTRIPVIYNTQPFTFNINQSVENYGFYVLPPVTSEQDYGQTYTPSQNAFIGTFNSGDFFAFKILGHDFDDEEIEFAFDKAPAELGLVYDSNTGWITGLPTITSLINVYNFGVLVRKKLKPTIVSQFYYFSFALANNIDSTIKWITDNNLGKIYNGTPSVIDIEADCQVELNYELVSGSLPDNLTLLPNGEIIGTVSFETTDDYLEKNAEVNYSFTVRAFDPNNSTVITSTKTFTLTVVQEFIKPTDTLYIECTPGIENRILIQDLLTNQTLIPDSYLYRPDDSNFGKATNVTYVHAYGIYASSLNEYIRAVQKNHYWRNITLGPLRTAVAKDNDGNIVYEVVYSEIIDDLVHPNYTTINAGNFVIGKTYTIKTIGTTNWYNIGATSNKIGTVFVATGKGTGTGTATLVTSTTSINEEIYWPRFIDLNLGPWYTSITDIYTSYIYPVELDIVTQDDIFYITTQENQNLATNQGQPTFYTSLTPGYARILYPNSLDNMRKRVQQELGYNTNSALLPLWMTSQQIDGSTTGFVQAWVICYTSAPKPVAITATQTTKLDKTITVSDTSKLVVGGQIVFSGNLLGDIQGDKVYYVVSINNTTNTIQISTTQYGEPISVGGNETGLMTAVFDAVSYAKLIKHNIENEWTTPAGKNLRLNLINFKLDRFTVNKSLTYNYDNNFVPAAWDSLPSGTPVPNPIDSYDFSVLFPQPTILPIKTQYPR